MWKRRTKMSNNDDRPGSSRQQPLQAGKQDRRSFLRSSVSAGVSVAAGSLVSGPVLASADNPVPINWDRSVDIVVVGGGAAGGSAAIKAHELGSEVLVLEKAPIFGGTAAKSVGGIWAPNNKYMQAAGLTDNRDDALKFMVRLSHPQDFNPDAEFYGAPEAVYLQLGTFYDTVNVALDELESFGALQTMPLNIGGMMMPDYFSHLAENKAPNGRAIVPQKPNGSLGNGAELMRQLKAAVDKRRIPVLTRHRADDLVLDDSGRVIGIVAIKRDGTRIKIEARKGVIFGSGGFTHNKQLQLDFLKGPIFGGCAVPTCEGDFIPIATRAGAQLGNMSNAWWAQLPLELALENPSVPTGIWCSPGDSMVQVNRFGKRFFDEKFVYNERTQVQFQWDPVSGSYPNLLSFLIYDQRTADEFANYAPLPPKGSDAAHVIKADTLEALEQQLVEKLRTIESRTAKFTLDDDFLASLKATVKRFNGFAESGVDEDFNRGGQPIDQFFHFFGPNQPTHNYPNMTLHPIATSGPYYAVILAAGTLDTKGGPKINEHAQVIDTRGQPIPGLYGAGNCIASMSGPAYWAGGATLGPALTFGNIAATHALTAATVS
ncbi:MAG: flavoprotein [Gammaproteobacteria bacterium]|nr:MAG: flavoprotein [Gammaproteobacteria bacterium]